MIFSPFNNLLLAFFYCQKVVSSPSFRLSSSSLLQPGAACWHLSSWWLNQPIWKIWVKQGIFPKFRGEHKQSLKPPPCCGPVPKTYLLILALAQSTTAWGLSELFHIWVKWNWWWWQSSIYKEVWLWRCFARHELKLQHHSWVKYTFHQPLILHKESCKNDSPLNN